MNAYLIEDEPLTLVDTGPNSPETLDALERALAARGHRTSDVGLILITHHHADHAGLAGALARCSGAEVAALDRTAAWMAAPDERTEADARFAERLMLRHGVPAEHVARLRASQAAGPALAAPAAVTVPLADGQALRLRDRTLRVIHRPGHSPTDTLFLDAERRVLLGGDHLLGHISSNPLLGSPGADERAGAPKGRSRPGTARPSPPVEGAEAGDECPRALRAYLDALRTTRAMDLDVILPGHGDEVRDHVAVIDRRLRTVERRAAKIRAAVADEPLSAHEIAHRLWGRAALTETYLTLCEVLGHLDLLAERGEVVEQNAGGLRVFGAR